MERYEFYQEKVNQQEVLNLANNTNTASFGKSHFIWGLRNTFTNELESQGHEAGAFDSKKDSE